MVGKYALDQYNLQAYFHCDLFVDFIFSAHKLLNSDAVLQVCFGTRVGYVIYFQAR